MNKQLMATPSPSGAMDFIMRAVNDPAFDATKLRELLAVRAEWMADEARGAFNAAVVRFQQGAKIVAKGDTANGRAYARLDRIWREVRPIMEDCGLAVTWESVKTIGDVCILDGHLRHINGHAQPLHHEMPLPEKITGQNSAQRAGSGETYCKRYATVAALGIQTGEDNDGNVDAVPANAERIAEVREMIKACGRNEAKACAMLGVKRLEDASADQIETIAAPLERMANRRDPLDDLPPARGNQ